MLYGIMVPYHRIREIVVRHIRVVYFYLALFFGQIRSIRRGLNGYGINHSEYITLVATLTFVRNLFELKKTVGCIISLDPISGNFTKFTKCLIFPRSPVW